MTTADSARKEGERAGLEVAAYAVPMLAVLICVLVVGGHLITSERSQPVWGVVLFLCAAVLFVLPPLSAGDVRLGRQETDEDGGRRSAPLVRTRIWRFAFVVNSGILALFAYWTFADNRMDRGVWFWAAAVVYLIAGLSAKPEGGVRLMVRQWWHSLDRRTVVMLLIITTVGAFFRFFRLGEVPVEMTSDHAEKLLDVFDVLEGLRPVFFPRNTGREAFQFYLTAALIRWTPLELDFMALKAGTALFGLLTVPATYFLGKELGGRRVGMVAAFLLAISYWHVAITRVGLRFPFTAAFAAPALYFLFVALRTNRRNAWLAAGGFLGAGLHTYTAMRIVPLLFVLLVLMRVGMDVVAYIRPRQGRGLPSREQYLTLGWSFWQNALAGGALAVLVFLPLLRYMQDNPERFWYRATSRAQETLSLPEMWATFWSNVANALLMFNYRGDVVPMNTVPESPVLGPISGGLFVLGVVYLLWQLLGGRRRAALYILASSFVFLLPSILSLAFPGENPSVVRTGGAIPFVMIIAAMPFVALVQRIERASQRPQRVVAAALAAVLLGSALLYNYSWYFNRYDENIRRSIWNASEMGAVLRAFEEGGGELINAYHVAYPHWVDTRNIAIHAGEITWHNAVTDIEEIAVHATRPGSKLYLVFPDDEAAIGVLWDVYPNSVMRLIETERPGKEFLVFEAVGPDSP